MAEQTVLVANWKMNLPAEGIAEFCGAMSSGPDLKLVIAPPMPFVSAVRSALADKTVSIAGQNCADHESGAFTGEVSASMLRQAGAEHVIVGHSERRTLYGETDAVVRRKAELVLGAGLTPILCVGESAEVRDQGGTGTFVGRQLRKSLPDPGAGQLIVAYEPVWAIGTGRSATAEMIEETHKEIRGVLAELQRADALLLYGGSVTADNADELSAIELVDGFLVGGASLTAEKFLAIARSLSRDRRARSSPEKG